MSPVSREMVTMRIWPKKRAAGCLGRLLAPALEGMARALRGPRTGFCSRQKGSGGNGGEVFNAAGCPGSPRAASEIMAGAGCEKTP